MSNPISWTANENDTLTASVARTLTRRISQAVTDLRIHSHGGGLVLSGQAASHYVKQMVQQAVMNATGAVIVANEIEVVGRRRPPQDRDQ